MSTSIEIQGGAAKMSINSETGALRSTFIDGIIQQGTGGGEDADRFLQALRRFIGRRGYCSDIYSDNGTNFFGSRSYLRELLKLRRSDQHKEAVSEECANNHTTSRGGLWEAAVRSAKKYLLKVLGENAISLEDMTTLLVQMENLNSRPITALTDDPYNLKPLTPGRFLMENHSNSCLKEVTVKCLLTD
ncbi:uncharacterized protein LOC129751975 [Uranotaenia lowii]|uniref:uncharacterized protein LOC129751975 n=1 Tax=Uranotaenia lowii TaxID=190385 RepID=UPI002478DBBE|nr:uncharacterized protein LOC129751975 [Uranotaenia lowii]